MATFKWARRRRLDTAKTDLKPPLVVLRRQGVHREVGSEWHEEKYRAVIEGEHQDRTDELFLHWRQAQHSLVVENLVQ